jgi:F-box protein, helicase, 18
VVGARAMELTEEQQRVVRSRAGRLAVQAGAGAAKTTTLCEYAAARPARRILYLAFNKSIQLEAQERMPTNVTARTTHSVSWRKAAELFGQRAKDRVGNTYPSSVSRTFGCGALAATAALQTIARWCGALEPKIGPQHVPPELAARMADPSVVVAVARDVWSAMVQGRVPEIRLPHDGYLKLFQMEEPVLRGFDTILVDEAQDLNLCTFDIVCRQRGGVVMVGDEAQGIYSFRGAMNALAIFEADERLPLTRSFRFGEGVAAVANALLSAFKPGFQQPLVGAGVPARTRFSVDTKKGFAVIARTNACIFAEAVSFLALNRRYHFVGGTEGYKLEKILDAYYLSCGDRGLMRDPYLRSFESFDALVALAEEAEDPELKHLVRVVCEYGHRVPDLVDEIKSRHVEMDKQAWRRFDGIFLSTAHKSKGLEFEQVWLADDYMRFFEDGKEVDPEEVVQEEVHILYVALTRARAALRLSESLEEWLRHKQLMPA